MDPRPAVDPAKLLASLDDWLAGDALPGRTMANLKTGEARSILEASADERAAALLAAWMRWEKGQETPLEVLGHLRDGGFRELLAASA